MRALTCILFITILCIETTVSYAQTLTSAQPTTSATAAELLDSMPIRIGPIGINPTLAVTNFGIDDNIFNDSTNPKRDFTMTATPRLQTRMRVGRVMLQGTVATGLVYYQEYDDERSIDYTAEGRVDLDLGWFQPYAVAALLDTRERLNVELDVRAPRTQTTVAAGTRLRLSAITGLLLDVRRAGLEFGEGTFVEGVPLSQTLNSETTTIEGGLELYLTPLTTFAVTASHQTDRFDQSPERDSDTLRVLPSIRLEAPAIIQGSLSVGYRRFTALSPDIPDYSGVVAKGSLTHTVAERAKLDLTLARDVQYSFEPTEPYYLTTGFRVTVTYQLQESIDVRGTGGFDRLDYREAATSAVPNEARQDRASMMGAGFGYRFLPNLRTGIDVEFARRASDRVDRRYDRTRVFASLTYGL